MTTERSAEDIRSLANRFRGMLSDRETQALATVRTSEVKEVGAPTPTPVGGTQTPAGVAERYRHLGEKTAEVGQPGNELRPRPTPEVPSHKREGPSR